MALVKKQNNNGRMVIIAVVVVVVGGIGYFLFQQLYLKNSSVPSGPTGGGRQVITNFGEAVLNDDRFKQLRPFGTTVNVDMNTDTGQPQPFQ